MMNILKKNMIVLILSMVMTPNMQGMIISQKEAAIVSTGATVLSLLVMSRHPNGHEHVAGIIGAGMLVGGFTFSRMREYVPFVIEQRARDTIDKMHMTNLKTLLESDDTSEFVDKIVGAYGLHLLEGAPKDIEEYKPLLSYHIDQFKKAKLNYGELNKYYTRLESINQALPSCQEKINILLDVQNKIIKNKKEEIEVKEKESRVQNEAKEVEIKNQEGKRKWWETHLNTARWLYPRLLTAGLAVWFVAWTLKLPYPHF